MTDPTATGDDLRGSADERMRQLAAASPANASSPEWLRRQLERALAAWAEDETQLDIDEESRVDY